MAADDYYARLQVSPSASRAEIKAAFRRLARQYHPDLNPDDPLAREKFHALREAYEVLSDRVQRHQYDQTGTAYQQTPPSTAQEFYLRGMQHILQRSYRAALDDFDHAIERQADFAEAYLRRAQVRYVLEDDSGVLTDCQRLLQLDQHQPQAYYYLGLGRYRLGYTESAIAAFDQAIKQDASDPQSYFQRAVAYADIRDWSAAVRDFELAALHYQTQGDMAGYHRSCDRIQQLKQHKKQRFRNSPKKASPSGKQRSTEGLLSNLGRGNRLLFGLLVNPAGQLLPLYYHLTPHQMLQVGCLLGAIASGSFALGGYVLRFAGDASGGAALGALWLAASGAFLSLSAMLGGVRIGLRRRGSWASDVLIAGAALLPLGIFTLAMPVALIFPWGLLLLLCFAVHHVFLTLHSGCRYIHRCSDTVAAGVAPSLLFCSLGIAYLLWSAWL